MAYDAAYRACGVLRIEHGKLQESTKHLDSQLKECQEDLAKKESKKGARQSQKGSK